MLCYVNLCTSCIPTQRQQRAGEYAMVNRMTTCFEQHLRCTQTLATETAACTSAYHSSRHNPQCAFLAPWWWRQAGLSKGMKKCMTTPVDVCRHTKEKVGKPFARLRGSTTYLCARSVEIANTCTTSAGEGRDTEEDGCCSQQLVRPLVVPVVRRMLFGRQVTEVGHPLLCGIIATGGVGTIGRKGLQGRP